MRDSDIDVLSADGAQDTERMTADPQPTPSHAPECDGSEDEPCLWIQADEAYNRATAQSTPSAPRNAIKHEPNADRSAGA